MKNKPTKKDLSGKALTQSKVKNPAWYVVCHAEKQKRKGKKPCVPYRDIKDPRRALRKALEDVRIQADIDLETNFNLMMFGSFSPVHVYGIGYINPHSKCGPCY